MDRHGIATGVLSVSTPGVHLGNDTEARRWAREVNEYTADLVRADPDRFGLFATLTLPDVEGAIAEAKYALDTLHADGVILLASNAGRYLGDPGFAPLLAYLHHRQAIVFVHPRRSDPRHSHVHRRLPARHHPHRDQPDPLGRPEEVRRDQVQPRARRRLRPLHRLPHRADHGQPGERSQARHRRRTGGTAAGLPRGPGGLAPGQVRAPLPVRKDWKMIPNGHWCYELSRLLAPVLITGSRRSGPRWSSVGVGAAFARPALVQDPCPPGRDGGSARWP